MAADSRQLLQYCLAAGVSSKTAKIIGRTAMSFRKTLLVLACAAAPLGPAAAQTPHNLILFVPDGLRAMAVTPQSAPAMAALRDKGVNFANPHSLFPTFTMPNSSGLATGHF